MTPVQQILQFIGTKELSPLADYIRKEILPLEEKMLGEAWEAAVTATTSNSRVSSDEWDSHYVEFDDHDIAKAKETYINSIINPQK